MSSENENKLAPIALFVYNRPWHTRQTIEALKKNKLSKHSHLTIYSDGAKNQRIKKDVDLVRHYINEISGFKSISVIERSRNWGLADSIIDGVTKIVNKYGKIIVLEDDIVTSTYFLKYMNDGLWFYENKKKIFSISGYNHPKNIMKIPEEYKEKMYFNYRNTSQGWATWADRWAKCDWEVTDYKKFIQDDNRQKMFNRGGDDLTDMLSMQINGKIDSWSIRWTYAHFKNEALAVYPVYSYVNNIGHDGTGVHSGRTMRFSNDLSQSLKTIVFLPNIKINRQVMNSFKNIYKLSWFSYIKKNIFKMLRLK